MFTLDQSPGRTAIINGKEYLFFSGYSYLGMSHVPEFKELAQEGINKYGILFPSSRVSNTRLNLFEEMESLLSQLTSQEETVVYSSGFLSGGAVVDWLANPTRPCFIAPGTHPALQTKNARLLREDWQQHLLELITQSSSEDFVVLLDSLNPLTATINDLSFLNNIPVEKKITCVIDDSHGIGLLGEHGEGISTSLPRRANVEYVITYSLSKAFHISGGAISCSKKIAAWLRQSSFYTTSTSIAPSLVYSFIQGQKIYNAQRRKLYENIKALHTSIENNQSIHFHQQLPIVIMPSKFEQDYFTPHNMIISSFAYPDPSGEKINRIVLNALHTKDDIKELSTIINEPA